MIGCGILTDVFMGSSRILDEWWVYGRLDGREVEVSSTTGELVDVTDADRLLDRWWMLAWAVRTY